MVTIQGRTREQLRVAVGYNLMGSRFHLGTITDNGSGANKTDFDDTALRGSDDNHNDKWIVLTSGSNDGEITRVSDYDGTNKRITVSPVAVGADFAAADTYEMWEEQYPPALVHEFLNQAIIDATGRYYDPEEDISLHGDGMTARFDLPTELAMVNAVEYRSKITSTLLHSCGVVFDESTDSDITQVVDTKDWRHGGGSLKLTVGSGISAGDFISDSFTAKDLSGYTHVEGWFKASTTLAANDLVLRLDSGTVQGDTTDLEIINLPATTAADTWTYFRVALANPESDTAIASIGIEYNANEAANTIKFDYIQAVANDTATWTTLNPNAWRIDPEAGDLVLTQGGRLAVGYSLLKIRGGDKPALLTTDASVTEVPDTFVIARATALALMAASGGQATDPEQRRNMGAYWDGRAQQEWLKFPILQNVRKVR